MSMLNFRPILLVVGALLLILSAFMLLPAIVDIYFNHDDWKAFVISAFFTAFVGGTIVFANYGKIQNFSVRQAFLVTTLSWLVMAAFSSLPFMYSGFKMSFTDAFFESMSGFTTTGSTVMVGLDNAPPGILLWRALIQGLGGIGIIVFAMAILPILKIGGMQLFRTESSDKSEKILPRAKQITMLIGIIYVGLVFGCFVAYWSAGMSAFDAICHAMPTVSTGGFSTRDSSIGYYDSVTIEVIAMVFMLLGALPFVLYIQMLHGNYRALFFDTQVRWFLSIVFGSIATIALWHHMTNEVPFEQALRHTAFSIISIITTAGFATTDYSAWGSFSITSFFMLTAVGGCTGSTSGGIKIFRYQVLYETAKSQVTQLIHPHGVFPPQFNGKPISETVTGSVMSFFILFAFCFMMLTVLLSMTGLDYLSSMSSVIQAMSNAGPGLGPIVGPAGNFSSLTDAGKWILSIAMLLGRLEIFTVLVLFSAYFWRN